MAWHLRIEDRLKLHIPMRFTILDPYLSYDCIMLKDVRESIDLQNWILSSTGEDQ
ncbi:putative indole-3-pyruvate monooxygenase YUCCA11 [Sesbania bispinosa]|nr:putative indole-3-pyruvate monooxygenase YUCCA11 [Sesbania bispinosa]